MFVHQTFYYTHISTVKHIKTVDGLTGCYRGVVPKVCGNLVSAVVSQKMLDCLSDEEEITEEDATTPEMK